MHSHMKVKTFQSSRILSSLCLKTHIFLTATCPSQYLSVKQVQIKRQLFLAVQLNIKAFMLMWTDGNTCEYVPEHSELLF